jgi:hypothetical protein
MAIENSPDDISSARRDVQEKAAEAARADNLQHRAVQDEAAAAAAHADAAELHREAARDSASGDEILHAKIAARQAEAQAKLAAAERNFVDREVGVERRRASTYTFGFALTLAVLGAALIVGLLYLFARPTGTNEVVVNAGTLPPGRSTVFVQPPNAPTVLPPRR